MGYICSMEAMGQGCWQPRACIDWKQGSLPRGTAATASWTGRVLHGMAITVPRHLSCMDYCNLCPVLCAEQAAEAAQAAADVEGDSGDADDEEQLDDTDEEQVGGPRSCGKLQGVASESCT